LRLALAITCHERPEALGAVLASVARQHQPPDEILIADDGSGPATRGVIDDFLARSRVPARLVEQPHEGFRVARLRNLAIAATRADHIVFVDGDMCLHPRFVADHRAFARPGWHTQGVRVLADETLSRRLIAEPGFWPTAFSAGLGGPRRAYLVHAPWMARLTRHAANAFIATKSCNLGVWRGDLLRVNGFDEDFVGWGPEDKDLVARLGFAGVRRQTLLWGGIAVHLHHAPAPRDALAANLARLEATRRRRRVRCEHGLDAHLRG
jgi:glycosyltransferase involved in cell wall biosynthesis